MPRTKSAVLGGLPFTSSDFRDSRAHGPRRRMDNLSAPFGRFVARLSASVATVDCRPGLFFFSPTANPAFASVFVVPSGGDQCSAEALATATIVVDRAPLPTSTLQGEDSATTTDPAASAPSPPGNPAPLNVWPPSGRISTRTRRQQPLPLAPCRLVLNLASGPAGPLDHPSSVQSPRESHGRDRLHPSLWPQLQLLRRSRRYPSRSTATTPIPREVLIYGFGRQLMHRPSPRLTWMPSAQLPNFSSVILLRAIRTPTGLGNKRLSPRATPPCATSPLAGRKPCPSIFCHASLLACVLPFGGAGAGKHKGRVHTTDVGIVLLVRLPPPPLTPARNPRWVVRPVYRTPSLLAFMCRCSCVPGSCSLAIPQLPATWEPRPPYVCSNVFVGGLV